MTHPDRPPSPEIDTATLDRSFLHQFWWVGTLIAIFILSFGLNVLGSGLSELVGDRVEQLFNFATNPALGLLVGVITTALVQ